MPVSTWSGGHVQQANDADNFAAVDTAQSTQIGAGNTGDWVLTLKSAPTKSNYTKDMVLDYNSKGTHNSNSRNDLTVDSVVGPAKYKCTGPYPINL